MGTTQRHIGIAEGNLFEWMGWSCILPGFVLEESINPQTVQISGPTGDPQGDMGVEHQGSAGS